MIRTRKTSYRLGLAIAMLGSALITLHLGGPGDVLAASTSWSKPIRLSGEGTSLWSWFPAIATDPYGGVHVVWNGSYVGGAPTHERVGPVRRPSDDASALFYTYWNRERWSGPNDIAVETPLMDTLRSSIAADGQGLLYLAYRGLNLSTAAQLGGGILRFSVARIGEADRVAAWSPGEPFSRFTPTYFPAVVTDSRNAIHLMWTEHDGDKAYGIYYKHSADGGQTWSAPKALEEQRPVYYFRAQIKVGPRDDLHAVWEVVSSTDAEAWAPLTNGFIYAESRDGGDTWSKVAFLGKGDPLVADSPGYWPVEPAVGIDGNGQVLLVWRDYKSNVIYSQRSLDGSTWSTPAPVPGIERGIPRPFDRYDMAVDSDGHVHLVAVGYPSGSDTLALVHSQWDGTAWSVADVIVAAPPFPEWPGIAISEGNRLNVVWFDGDSKDVSRTPVGIRYTSARSTARSVAPLERPALPTPTPTVVPPPSAAILAERPRIKLQDSTADPGTSDSSGSDLWNAPDANVPLLLATVAVAGILVAIVLLAQVRRTGRARP